jgi:5-methyltetrahydrofolate--homocysteine methyltransferase
LRIMEDLVHEDGARTARLAEGKTVKHITRVVMEMGAEPEARRSPAAAPVSDIPKPAFYGVRVAKDFDLREVFQYINETALFKNQWQLKTASAADYKRLVEEKYKPILAKLRDEVAASGWLEPKAVYGWFACQSEGNDLILYDDASGMREVQRFTFPRQREGRLLSVADFFAARDSGRMDVVGLSVVTVGARASEETKKMFDAGEYTRYLYLHGLSVETAEALAELLHKRMRAELGISGDDAERITDLFHQKYRGSRYSFGYPACPNLEDQTKIFELLRPEENIGVRLTSGFQLEPEQSTSAIVVHHPAAKYFVV